MKFFTLSAALMLSGSSFQRHGAEAQNALSPNLFRLVCGICIKFLVFDLRVLVLARLTNISFRFRGAHPCMFIRILPSRPLMPIGSVHYMTDTPLWRDQ